MLDKFLLFGVVLMGVLMIVWGLASFIMWDATWLYNIAEWDSVTRFGFVMAGAGTVLLSAMIVTNLND